MVGLATYTRTGKQIAADFSAKNVTFMAAGLAYNAFVSLAPLLLLVLFVTSVLGGDLEGRLVALAQSGLPTPIANVVTQVFQGESGVAGASAVGIVVLLWGTLKIFRGLDTAFSEIYETEGKNTFVDQLVDGLIVLVALLVAIVATIGATAVFAVLAGTIPFVQYLTPVVLIAGLVVAFLPIYYRFPDTDLDWEHVLPGAIFAAVGWAALQAVFQVYLTFSSGGSGDFFGGVIVVITWLYFSGLVLLLGAVINAVIGGYSSGKAGGVGQGATGHETDREETLDREEFAEYLTELRAELTSYDAGTKPFAEPQIGDRHLDPETPVTLIEQKKRDGDKKKWAVSFRWTTDETSAGRSNSTDD
ncbi:YihY/virulence factor BrkB family protein [Halorientalis brevis]|uniref:YihY/virulence factor BrkB family protein n=1 Tax=Halorientalis brevis TaxID=1126241 RepID=A0ABD6CC97_9EURY|nr:YihY/virulence factor BrkB family protein [Halorientalis brevis]